MTLHNFLTRLIWFCIAPLILLAVYLAVTKVIATRADIDLDASNLAQNFATAIDQNLTGRIGALRMLALSPLLNDTAHERRLYEEAQSFRQSFGSHVILTDLNMRMLFNTRVPFGTPLPTLPQPKGHAAAPVAVRTGKPAVGDIVLGPVANEPLIAIAVPCLHDGKTERLLLTTFETSQFQNRLDKIALRSGWRLGLFDSQGGTIARRGPTDWNPTKADDSARRFVVKSTVSPWSVVLDIPPAIYHAPLIEAAIVLVAAILGATLIGVYAGTLASRRLGRMVASLAESPVADATPSSIAEIAVVRSLLDQAALQRDAAKTTLLESERRLKDMLGNMDLVAVMLDPEGQITYCNDSLLRLTGWRYEEVIGRNWFAVFVPAELGDMNAAFQSVFKSLPETWLRENKIQTRSGERRLIRWNNSVLRSATGDLIGIASIGEDITERKKAEDAIVHLNRVYAMLSGISALIVHVRAREDLFKDACRVAVEAGGFRMAWVAMVDRVNMKVVPAASAGMDDELLAAFKERYLAAEGGSLGNTRAAQAITENKVIVTNDIVNKSTVAFGERYAERGIGSMAMLPLVVANKAVGAIALYAHENAFFHEEELKLLTRLAGDIAFAIEQIEKEERIVRLSRIQSFMSAINVLIVRVRDRKKLLEEACRIAVEHGGFSIAWIGMLDQKTLDIVPAACAGFEAESLMKENRNTSHPDAPHSWGLVGRAIIEKRPIFSNELASEARGGSARRKMALERGYHSLISLPLMVRDNAVGSISLFAKEPNFFNEDEIQLLSEMAGNVAFALDLIQKGDALADSEKKLDRILSTLQEVVWSMDPSNGHIVYVNPAVRQLTRRSVVEFLSQSRLWRRMVHPDDRPIVRDAIRKLLRDGKLIHEFRIVLADGEERMVQSNARVRRDDNGQASHIDGTISDVTARKHAEDAVKRERALLRAVVDAIPDRIYVKDRLGRFLLQNSTNLKVRGVNTVEDILGKTVFDIFPADLAKRVHLEDEAIMSSGKPLLNREGQTVFGGSGTNKPQSNWHLSSKMPLKDEAGNVYGLVGVNRDITDRKSAEEALRKLNEELEDKVAARTADMRRAQQDAEEANRAKSAFLATMSHEIRTPMNGVVGMIDVLHQSSLKADQVEMVELIRESAFSLLGIINDILDFSKIEAGKLELDPEPLNLGELVESVCAMLDRLAQKKDVELLLYADPEIPEQVMGDALRIRQVLINLTSNAIKFSGGQSEVGKVSVRILLVKQNLQQVTVEFRVTDNGIGMDEETQARLFTAFTQADISTTRRFGGTGLGLAIANNLVELMGGKIEVQSASGEGATFKVCLTFATLPGQTNSVSSVSEVAGLDCVVVGTAGGLADDLATYLRHGHAMVERLTDLSDIPVSSKKRGGPSVWIVDIREGREMPEQIAVAARDQSNSDVRFVAVLIERGQRRQPRVVSPSVMTIDGNALDRGSFLKLIAVAAGRTQMEEKVERTLPGKFAVIAPSRDEALRQGRLILIAEDNETNQKVIVRQLALLGYTADVASDGSEALRRWRSGNYALLLTDLHMPEMDGYELTQAIRAEEKDGKRIPIIALTANALKGEADRCRAVGMDDYRSKPSPLAELKSVLDKWLPVIQHVPEPIATLASSASGQNVTATPVDIGTLKKLVGDDPGLIREFLQDFRISAAKITAELRTAFAAKQMKDIAAAMHKLKSSASAVGAAALSTLCADMEENGNAENMDALLVLLPKLEKEMAAVEDYLKRL